MNIRAVVFDMDGLMVDTERLYWAAGRALAQDYGTAVRDQTLGRMMGRSPVDSMAVFAAETGIEKAPETLLEERDSRVLVLLEQGVTPMPGLFESLEELASRYELAIATSAPRRFVDVINRSVPFLKYFRAVQTSEGVVEGKPAPEIYLKAMAKLAVQPAYTVVLEDSSNGARAGKRAGAYTIAVPSEHTRDQDFSFVDFRASNLIEAVEHVGALDGTNCPKQTF